jgi:AcrR family transcriptional regulator
VSTNCDNKSLVFQYFGKKSDLYRAVVARTKQRVEEALGRILADYVTDTQPPDARHVRGFVEDAMRWSFDHYLAYPRDRRILVWETTEGWSTFNCIATAAGRTLWPTAVIAFLRRAQEAGVLRRDIDLEVLLSNLMGMALCDLVTFPRFERMFGGADHVSPASPEALAYAREQIVALVLHGTMTAAALASTDSTDSIASTAVTDTADPSTPTTSPTTTEEATHATGL